jgi:ABC-type phosphate transport system substrate-binding protein
MKRRFAVAVLIAALASGQAEAGEVIAHDSVSLNADEVRDVFLGEKQFSSNLRLVPVDNNAVQTEFLARVLQTDRQKYVARWTRKTFREGLPAPVVKGSDAEVIAFVRATPGAVGYVSGTARGVKVLEKF